MGSVGEGISGRRGVLAVRSCVLTSFILLRLCKFNDIIIIVTTIITIITNSTTKVQRLSFEYFTSRGCSTNRDEEVNWVTTMPNSLSLYPICCLGPC